MYLKRSWSDFDPQAYYLYGEDQNHETSFKGKALQAVADSWCKIQVLTQLYENREYFGVCLSVWRRLFAKKKIISKPAEGLQLPHQDW